jgi:hypothetical protein
VENNRVSAFKREACLQVKKMMRCGVEMPELQFVEPQKIGSGLGILKNSIQDERIQSKEEGSNGFSRVIWEISVKMAEVPKDELLGRSAFLFGFFRA